MKSTKVRKLQTFEELASQYNTDEIVAALIGMQYWGKRELNNTYLIAAELFASNAIRYNISDKHKKFSIREHKILAKNAKRIMRTSCIDYFLRAIKMKAGGASDQQKEEFLQSIMMEAKNEVFRGDGYVNQLIQMAELLYKPFDKELKNKFGFSFSCCEAVLLYIVQKYQVVFSNTNQEIRFGEKLKIVWNTITRNNPYTVISSKITTEYRIYKEELYAKYPKKEIDAMLSELAIRPGDKTLKRVGTKDFKPLYAKPFVDFGAYIYLPLPESTLLNLPKLFHYFFVSDTCFDNDIKGVYNNVRGDVVEKLTIKYLGRIYEEDKIFQSLKYPKKKKTYEADVTVQNKDYTIFSECKAKILVSAALSGDIKVIRDDVYKAIGKAYEQAIRTVKYIHTGKPFYDEKTMNEVILQDTKRKYILCVNIEHFGFVPSEIKEYITIDPTEKIIPIAINTYDLDIITAECKDGEEFLKYLDFKIMNDDILKSVDELEVFAYFKKFGGQKIKTEGQEIYLPINLMEFLDIKYQMEATQYILTKNTDYSEEFIED